MGKKIRIMIVAGEASGDTHGAKLVNSLRAAASNSEISFFGAAGPAMREAGVEAIVRSDGLAIVGLPEIARAIPMFLAAFRSLRRAAIERKPDAVILIDFPDFNLKLAKSLKRRGLTVIYYISPQLWAWRKYRLRTIRKYVDLLITILPFEKDWYLAHGIRHVEYVGSPLAREVHSTISKDEFCQRHGLDTSKPIVCLLPGSRHKEITRILPVMLEAAAEMVRRRQEIQFLIALSSLRSESEVHNALSLIGGNADVVRPKIRTISGETYDALNAADAAAITSGTATLEAGIIGTPMAIVYKTSAFNYKLLRPLINVEHFGLINLIAGKRIAVELIQDEFTASTLAEELFRLLEPAQNQLTRTELKTAAAKLGHGGASARAADLVVRFLEQEAVPK